MFRSWWTSLRSMQISWVFLKLQRFLLNKIGFVFILMLVVITTDLENRVVFLEENGGSDGNSSVAELEVRVETLEGTAADHKTRISIAEVDINGMISSYL